MCKGSGSLFLLLAQHYKEILVHRNMFGQIYYKGTFNAGLIRNSADINQSVDILERKSDFVFIGGFL